MTEKNDKQQPFNSYKSLLSMDSSLNKNRKPSAPRKEISKENSSAESKRARSKSPRRDYKKGRSSDKPAEKKENYDIPDRSFGDLYCKACDSHMNSDAMWDLHLQGKRHLKNTKSAADQERKHIYLDQKPEAQAEIDAEKLPIVGLQHVCEIIRLEQRPIYNCFLCNSNLPNPQQLVAHLLGLKHRLAFLKEHDPERYGLIQASNLKKGQVEPVVEECVAKHEFDNGRGKMIVKKEKPKSTYTWGVKKNSTKDYQDSYPLRRSEREDTDYNDVDWKRMPSHHSSRSNDYDDRDRKYSDSPRNSDKYYSEKSTYREADSERPYSRREFDRGDDYRTNTEHLSNDAPPERNYSLREADSERPYSRREFDRDDDYRTNTEHLSNDAPPERNYSLSAAVPNRLVNAYESRSVDLREILEQKKAPSLDGNIPDEVLGIFSALPSISFFQLVLFKLDNMKIEDEVEIKFLDRVVNKATTLAMSVKSKLLTPTLRAQFKESMAQNGIEMESSTREPSKDVQDLLQMVGEAKALSSLRTQNTTVPVSPSPYQTTTELDALRNYYSSQESSSYKSTTNPIQSYSATAHDTTTPYASHQQGVAYPERYEVAGATRSEPGYSQPVQNSRSSLSSANSSSYSSPYSSSYSSIPGLTLANKASPEKELTAVSSPFARLHAQTKSLFGESRWNDGNQHYNYGLN